MTESHIQRVREELIAAGTTKYGMLKFASRYLPNIIHENECIRAVVYGRHKMENFALSNEGMLVATNKRMIFIERKPGYTSVDELSYEVVAGLNVSVTPFFSAITLYTRMSSYTIRFANKNCVNRFAEYVERRRLDMEEGRAAPTPSLSPEPPE